MCRWHIEGGGVFAHIHDFRFLLGVGVEMGVGVFSTFLLRLFLTSHSSLYLLTHLLVVIFVLVEWVERVCWWVG